MDFVSPTEWGARVNYDTWSDTPYLKDDVAIHYGGPSPAGWADGPDAEARILRAYEAYHIDEKGWRGIAYGYAVGASGTVYRLRGKNNYGAHQGDHDGDGISNNKEVVPILFICGEGDEPTAEMWLGARALYQWLLKQSWTYVPLGVYGHKEIQLKPTKCPGPHIMHGIHEGWVQIPPPASDLEARVERLEVAADEAATFRDATTRKLSAITARLDSLGSAITELEAVVGRLVEGARRMAGD